jgi:hypothetical protein
MAGLDSRRASKAIAAFGLVAGPTLFLITALVAPAFTVAPEEPGAYLDQVRNAPSRHLLAAVLFFAGGLLFVPGLVGAMRLLRGSTVGLGELAVALVALAVLTLPGFYMLNVVQAEMADAAADRAQMDDLLSRIEEGTGGTLFMAVWSTGAIAGVTLLAVILLVRRAVPIWGPIALILAVVVGFFPDRRLWSVIEFSMLLIGTSAIAWRIWTTSDEAWSHWEPAAR